MNVGGPLEVDKVVNTAAFDCSANTYDALRYVTYLLFGGLYLLILNCNPNS